MDKPPFEESLRALAARRRGGESHPTLDELIAYRAGDLTPEEDDVIQEHLTQCRDCARLLLDLAEFEALTPPPVEIGPVDVRAEASWQRLRSRLREENEPVEDEPAKAPVLRHQPRPRVPVWQSPMLPWALAAGLTICVAGLGLRMGSLQQELAKHQSPRLNVPFEDLSLGETRSAVSESPVLEGGGVLIFTPSVEAEIYEIEVTSAEDEALVIGPLRGPAIEGVLTLDIPPSLLPVGEYFAHLYAVESGERSLLRDYAFRIAPAAQ